MENMPVGPRPTLGQQTVVKLFSLAISESFKVFLRHALLLLALVMCFLLFGYMAAHEMDWMKLTLGALFAGLVFVPLAFLTLGPEQKE
jgi:hypothetical protein